MWLPDCSEGLEDRPNLFTIHPKGQALETMRGLALALMRHWTQHWRRSRRTREVCLPDGHRSRGIAEGHPSGPHVRASTFEALKKRPTASLMLPRKTRRARARRFFVQT